jgi:hypothetical protein
MITVMKAGCLVLLLVSLAQAQHSLSVPFALEHAVKENLPGWTLISVHIRKTKEENNANFRWKREDKEVSIFVNEYNSTDEARITPQSLITAAPRRQERIQNIGDEAYIVSPSAYGDPRFDVIFRKGKVRVSVEAASADITERFAKHIADAIPDA